jgi:hypothetical protein
MSGSTAAVRAIGAMTLTSKACQLGGREGGGRAEGLDGGGVVDQDVDVDGPYRLGGGGGTLLGVTEISGNDADLAGQGTPAQGHGLSVRELAGRPGDQHEGCSGCGEFQGDGLPDTASRTRHQRRPASELSYHPGLPC